MCSIFRAKTPKIASISWGHFNKSYIPRMFFAIFRTNFLGNDKNFQNFLGNDIFFQKILGFTKISQNNENQPIVMLLKQLLFHLFLFKYNQYKWIWATIHIVIWTVLVVVNIFLNCLNDVEWWVSEINQFLYFVLFSLFLSNFFRWFYFMWYKTYFK